jgi:hypothetical protein
LLGSIKIRASGIKATLQKTKDSLVVSPHKTDTAKHSDAFRDLDASVIVEIKDRACLLNTTVVHVADEPKDDMAESLANVSIVEKGFVDEFNQSVDINEIIFQEKL